MIFLIIIIARPVTTPAIALSIQPRTGSDEDGKGREGGGGIVADDFVVDVDGG